MPPKDNSRPNSPLPFSLGSIEDELAQHISKIGDITISKTDEAKRLWLSILRKEYSTANALEKDSNPILDTLSKIRILDDPSDNESWLLQYGGHLSDVPLDFIEKLGACAPQTFSARVADFNENLFYRMQEQCGLEHFGLRSDTLHEIIGSTQFLVSFLSTETTTPQPPHVDFPWEFLEERESDVDIGFFPLTEDGMFLQVWPRNDDPNVRRIEGEVIYIPYGKVLTLPSGTIHGGGFRSTINQQHHGNLRTHLYIARNEENLPTFQTNKYTEPRNKRRELCERYVDAPPIKDMIEYLFV